MNILEGNIYVKRTLSGFAVMVSRGPDQFTMLATTNTETAADGIRTAFSAAQAAVRAIHIIDELAPKPTPPKSNTD